LGGRPAPWLLLPGSFFLRNLWHQCLA
jgi:hypothetical protein